MVKAFSVRGAVMLDLPVSRRTALGEAAAFVALPAAAPAAQPGTAFSWGALQRRALDLADRPYAPPTLAPASVKLPSYDALNRITFRPEHSLLGTEGTPAVRLFPLTQYARTPVSITLVENGHARPIPFSRDLFAGGETIPSGAEGFSGFRVMNPGGVGDWLAFQGASYFRSAGALDQYGLSARALAIDTGLERAEEFPRFTHFWLESGPADAMTVYALLDSPSAAGAWRFVNRRSPAGVTQEVSFVLRLRDDVTRLGLAPLTSMFWYGEGNRAQAEDWRPEIHDSDGLAMLTGQGERLWRPLANPVRPITSSFADADPRGFGLLQRDRAFDHYQDDGVFYERRPSLWVEPGGAWGPGSIMLVELPTRGETDDNIGACWSPALPARRGDTIRRDYRLRWIGGEPEPHGSARVVDCWRGRAGSPGTEPVPGATRLVADFAGQAFAGLNRTSGVQPVVSLSRGTPLSVVAYPVVGREDCWRMIVDVNQPGDIPLELRAFLRFGNRALTETLLYQFL